MSFVRRSGRVALVAGAVRAGSASPRCPAGVAL